MKRLLLATTMLFALASGAQSEVFTFNPTFSDTSVPAGNGLNYTGSFSTNSVNVPLAGLFVDNFLTITSTNDFCWFCVDTNNLLVNFTFTVPGAGVGDPNIGGTGTETTILGFMLNGVIDWADNATVSFADGSSLAIQLLDTTYDKHHPKAYVDANFVLVSPSQVPGPVAGALLPGIVSAFGLLGFSAWRRRRQLA